VHSVDWFTLVSVYPGCPVKEAIKQGSLLLAYEHSVT